MLGTLNTLPHGHLGYDAACLQTDRRTGIGLTDRIGRPGRQDRRSKKQTGREWECQEGQADSQAELRQADLKWVAHMMDDSGGH